MKHIKKILVLLMIILSIFLTSSSRADTINQKQFDYTGITQYHQQNITGDGIKILFMDMNPLDVSDPVFNNKVTDTIGNMTNTNKASHSANACQVLHQIAPNAEIYVYKYDYGCEDKAIDYAITNGIQIVCSSTYFYYAMGYSLDNLVIASRKATENNIILVVSAGNYGKGGMGSPASNVDWLAVGAVDFDYNSKVQRQDYSSYDIVGSIAFTSFTNTLTTNTYFGGTSCSAPFATGQIALYMEQFKKDYGRLPTKAEILLMIRYNSEDLGEVGRDIKTGVGLLKLPPITNYKTELSNKLAVKMIKPNLKRSLMDNDEMIYIHKDWVSEYLKDGYIFDEQ